MTSARLMWMAIAVLLVTGLALAQEGPPPGPQPPDQRGGPGMMGAPPGGQGQAGGAGRREMGPPMDRMPGGMMGSPEMAGPRDLPAEEEERILSFMKDFDPGRFAELQSLRERERPAYLRGLREAQRGMREFEELKGRDPARAELMKTEARLRGEVFALVRGVRESVGRAGVAPEGTAPQAASPDEVRTKLADLVAKLFDVKVEMRKQEIERLREELKKHEETLAKAQEQKKELVKRRIDLLLGEQEDVFDW
ncbi:MAG: hypothetical protein V2A58_06710 [Planctomycetota bacterium]